MACLPWTGMPGTLQPSKVTSSLPHELQNLVSSLLLLMSYCLAMIINDLIITIAMCFFNCCIFLYLLTFPYLVYELFTSSHL